MALNKITYTNKETLVDLPNVQAKNKCTSSDMNEIKSVVNNAIDQIDTNKLDISTLDGDITTINSYLSDYVKLVAVSYGSSITLNAYEAKEIEIATPVPTITGYKCLGCVGGTGDGAIGLVVQPSIYNSVYGYNRWVFNAVNYQVTYNDVTFLLLYVRNL